MTTRHLVSTWQRRKRAALLPIPLPNSEFLCGLCNGRAKRGGRGQPDAVAESYVSVNSHGNFVANGPCEKRGNEAPKKTAADEL